MDSENKNGFSYTYSAREIEEIKEIKSKYSEKPENKLEQIKKLDSSATIKGMVGSLTLGILGALIMGGGMAMCLVLGGMWFIPGIILGVFGILACALAYPVYGKLVEMERKRLAPVILALIDELEA